VIPETFDLIKRVTFFPIIDFREIQTFPNLELLATHLLPSLFINYLGNTSLCKLVCVNMQISS